MPRSRCIALLAALLVLGASSARSGERARWFFDFGPGPVAEGAERVLADARYSDETGYGFTAESRPRDVDRGGADPLGGDFVTGEAPFSFQVKVPEGNYRITITLGDAAEESTTTIHAEVRRLLADRLRLAAGEAGQYSAVVAVRTPHIPDNREVGLKDRERTDEWANWDDKLTLTFSGAHPAVAGLTIERDDACPTLFLIGDSTVSDQAIPPWNSWGQMLPRFFAPTIAVANHAESGESVRSALGERRFAKLYSQLKPGDWVAIQFGHNDMKAPNYEEALERYRADLETIGAEIRKRGAEPIFITSMERKGGLNRDTLLGYPDTAAAVATKLKAPLVDLHDMSQTLYRAMGDDLNAAFQDGTHHRDYGSYQLARCVVEGIRASVPELAKHLASDAGTFDPARPEPASAWGVPTQPAGK